MNIDLTPIVLPTPSHIATAKHRFKLFGPTIADVKGETIKQLRNINKIKDVAVLDYNKWDNYNDDAPSCAVNAIPEVIAKLVIMVRDGHMLFKDINQLKELGRGVDYNYLPISINDNGETLNSAAIEIKFASVEEDTVNAVLSSIEFELKKLN